MAGNGTVEIQALGMQPYPPLEVSGCSGVVDARHCAKVTMENQSRPSLLMSACMGRGGL